MIRTTTAYHKITDLTKEVRVIQGGTGAGKTYAILIDYHIKSINTPNLLSTVVTETYPQLRDGVIKDMKNIFTAGGLYFDDWYKGGDKEIVYPNGSIIQFRNIDNKDFHKAKGARRDRLFLNEANRMNYLSVDQMIGRSHIDTTIDFNPDFEFWVHTELVGHDYVDYISLTYEDNEEIPESELKRILRRIEDSKKPGASEGLKDWVRIYAYGQIGSYSDRRIYPSFEFTESIPDTAIRINSGIDFGTSPDPTILVDMYIDGINLYVDERFCMNNLFPETIEVKDDEGNVIGTPDRLSVRQQMDAIDFPKGQMIVGDTDGKTAIIDMVGNGYNVRAVKKPPGSQAVGIGKVKCYNIKLTKRSINVKEGIEAWFYKADRNGKVIPEPDGHEPDGLAAMRYGVMTYIK